MRHGLHVFAFSPKVPALTAEKPVPALVRTGEAPSLPWEAHATAQPSVRKLALIQREILQRQMA